MTQHSHAYMYMHQTVYLYFQVEHPGLRTLSRRAQCGGNGRCQLHGVPIQPTTLLHPRPPRTHTLHLHGELRPGCGHLGRLEQVRVTSDARVFVVVFVWLRSCDTWGCCAGGRRARINSVRWSPCTGCSAVTASTNATSNSSSPTATSRASKKVRRHPSFSLLSPSCQLPYVHMLVIAWCEHVHAEAVPGSADPSFEVVRC